MIRLLDCFTVWLDPVPPIEPCLQLLCFGNKMFVESHGGLTQIVTPSPFHNGQPACGEMPLGASYLFPHMPLQPSFHLSPYLVSVLGWRRIALGAWGMPVSCSSQQRRRIQRSWSSTRCRFFSRMLMHARACYLSMDTTVDTCGLQDGQHGRPCEPEMCPCVCYIKRIRPRNTFV